MTNPNIRRTALVVIDVQVDFCSPQGKLAHQGRDLAMMEPMIDRLEAVLEQANHVGLLVLYAQQVYDPARLTRLQQSRYENDARTITCDIHTTGADFYRLRPTPGLVYQKTNFNVFSNEDFCRQLERHHIETVILTGVDTQYCIETAARSAFDLGYRVIVPRDLVATNAKRRDLHERTLQLIDHTFGTTTSAAKLLQGWQAEVTKEA